MLHRIMSCILNARLIQFCITSLWVWLQEKPYPKQPHDLAIYPPPRRSSVSTQGLQQHHDHHHHHTNGDEQGNRRSGSHHGAHLALPTDKGLRPHQAQGGLDRRFAQAFGQDVRGMVDLEKRAAKRRRGY